MSTLPKTFARSTAGVALLSLAWLALFAWARPLMLPDEGRYVGVAWEMMRSGDWLVPTLNGLPYFHKPPLFYWITAGAMSLFGPGEAAARAAPLLGAWAAALSVFLLLRRWWGTATARLALIVLLAQPLFYIGGQFANLDMLVAGCITATIALLAHTALLTEEGGAHRPTLLGAWAAAALGVLAKGLIGFLLPAMVIGAWLLLRRRWRTLPALLWPPGPALFLAIAAPWFVAMQARFPSFIDYFFVVQHFKRFAAGGFNNVQPFWFYPAVLLLFTLPWLPWLKPQFARGRLGESPRADLRLLMWAWLAIVVGFFSLPASKLLGYVLPAVPPLAVLLADGLESWRRHRPRSGRLWVASAGLTVALSLAAVGYLALRTPYSAKDIAAELRTQRGPGEPVYMLDSYAFDLPLYAHLPGPVGVVLDWAAPGIHERDTWRKELADAGGFAPARAHQLLLAPAELGPALCAQPVAWLVSPADADALPLVLIGTAVHLRGRHFKLWRLDRAQAMARGTLACPPVSAAG